MDFQDSSSGPKPSATFFLGVRHAGLECSAHGRLEALKEASCSAEVSLRKIHARRVHLQTRSIRGPLRLLVKAIELLPAGALNFICEGRSRGVRRFRKEGAGAFERVAHDFFHLRLRVSDKVAARMIQLAGKHAGNFSGFFPQLVRRPVRWFCPSDSGSAFALSSRTIPPI